MTISGIPAPLHDPRLARAEERAPASSRERQGPHAAAGGPARTQTAVVTPAAPRHSGAIPAEAPPGTDPALWSVLTGEERAFFARTVSGGPLTYTRMMGQLQQPAAAALPRGGRMDVRV